jgi:hypothetical protein
MKNKTLEEAFAPGFKRGMIHVGFFVRRTSDMSASALEQEAIRFQDVIQRNKVRQILSVD